MSLNFFRGRRLRESLTLRNMLRETFLTPEHLVLPVFVKDGHNILEPIESLPGHYRYSPDTLLKRCEEWLNLGLRSIMLFGIPACKDAQGSGAWDKNGVISTALRLIKKHFPELFVVADVCLCEYTSHGHCGVWDPQKQRVLNDSTLELLKQTALCYAEAQADMIAPSDMMDGRVLVLRQALDEAGFVELPLMSYAAKYCSAFYGPFRVAADSAPREGDRRGYQMDYANVREALREVMADIEEGADIVMVKPGLAYLDVVRAVVESVDVPVAVFNVSGEYTMVKQAAAAGVLNEEQIVWEILYAFRRAGARWIFSYHTLDVLHWLKQKLS